MVGEWMKQEVGGKEAEDIVADGVVPVGKFIGHAAQQQPYLQCGMLLALVTGQRIGTFVT